jgi:hypothetical protein
MNLHRLTLDQKIENYEQLLESKKLKYFRLGEEIRNISLKVEKLKLSRDKKDQDSDESQDSNESSSPESKASTIETSNYFQ